MSWAGSPNRSDLRAVQSLKAISHMQERMSESTAARVASPEAPAEPFTVPPAVLTKRPARSRPIGSTFVDWATLAERATAIGISRPVFDAPAPTLERFELQIGTLNPGKTPHAPHCHPWEEILIIKDGALEVSINGETQPAAPGDVIFFASNDVHTVVNRGAQPATFYVINFCTDAVHTVRDEPSAKWAPPGTLRSCVVHWDKIEPKPMTHDIRRSFLDSPTVTFTNLKIHTATAAAGRYPVRHSGHANLLLVIMKEGMMESNVDGVTHLVGPGDLVFLAPGAVQTLRNPGSVPATYYVIAVSSADTMIG